MAAGLGFKDFTTGEVLTAADVDGYLMQGVWVFASAAARDAAVTSPQEGNFAYLKDTNVTTYYTGSAWANLDTTGMTNPMTTTGDMIYSSSGSTPARLGIGSTGNVLTVAGGVPTWAAPGGAGANWTLLNSGGTSLSGSTTTVSGISGADKIFILIEQASSSNTYSTLYVRLNGDTGNNYYQYGQKFSGAASYNANIFDPDVNNDTGVRFATMGSSNTGSSSGYFSLTGCNSSGVKMFTVAAGMSTGGGDQTQGRNMGGYYNSSSAITSVSLRTDSGTWDNGTVYVYTSA